MTTSYHTRSHSTMSLLASGKDVEGRAEKESLHARRFPKQPRNIFQSSISILQLSSMYPWNVVQISSKHAPTMFNYLSNIFGIILIFPRCSEIIELRMGMGNAGCGIEIGEWEIGNEGNGNKEWATGNGWCGMRNGNGEWRMGNKDWGMKNAARNVGNGKTINNTSKMF